MALTPGTRLGVYEVIAQIGEGGVGQVFRPRDAKFTHDVWRTVRLTHSYTLPISQPVHTPYMVARVPESSKSLERQEEPL